MLSDRTFAPSMAEVTVFLMNGKSHSGHLARFVPEMPDIALALARDEKAKSRFAAEQVAYVAFLRAPSGPAASPSARRGSLKIHISGGKTFLVDVIDPEVPGSIGLYARPAEAQSPYREIFFYNHGINLREVNEPLGALLVKDGRVGAAALEAGLRAQRGENRTPIGQILVESKRVNQAALDQAAMLQQRKGTRIGVVLIEAGLADAADIVIALVDQRKRVGQRIGMNLYELTL